MLEEEIVKETKRQLEKIEKIRKKVEVKRKGKKILENIDAYISDCKYFLEKKKYLLAFEAIVWAWAWLEICKELKILDF